MPAKNKTCVDASLQEQKDDMEDGFIRAIATLESDIKHINQSLADIHTSIKQLQGLVTEQYDLRKDVSILLSEQEKMENDFSNFKKEFASVVENTKANSKRIEELPRTVKSNIFDYIWKYALIALGGWLVIKFTNLLPG